MGYNYIESSWNLRSVIGTTTNIKDHTADTITDEG